VRAAEAKMPFPTRADWDSFFRENKEMNEMKAGERPDTIKLENLPCKWFVNYQDKSGLAHDRPSQFVLKKAFETFGEIRIVDIPMLDPYR
jgi:arginine/serine-rich splicing factor 17